MNVIIRKFKTLMRQKHPVKFFISKVLSTSRLCGFFFINRNKYRLRFYPSALSRALWVDPFSRCSSEKFFQTYLRSGDVVIDVGANIGTLTLEASVIVGDSGKVFAIEANPRISKYLQGNIKLNRVKNVYTYNVALGNTNGTIIFCNSSCDDQNSVIAKGDGIEIPLCRLDDLPINEKVIDLLKIDVEGYEKFVLQGAKKQLQVAECIYFESWEQNFHRYSYTCGDLFEFLNNCGFQLFKILQETMISPIPIGYISEKNENLLAIRNPEKFLRRTSFQLKK